MGLSEQNGPIMLFMGTLHTIMCQQVSHVTLLPSSVSVSPRGCLWQQVTRVATFLLSASSPRGTSYFSGPLQEQENAS